MDETRDAICISSRGDERMNNLIHDHDFKVLGIQIRIAKTVPHTITLVIIIMTKLIDKI